MAGRIPRALAVAIPLALAAAAAVVAFRSRPVERTAGPITHDAYIWQRRWSEAVREAVARPIPAVASLCPLVTEIEWKAGDGRAVEIDFDAASLMASGRAVGGALRVGPFPGPFAADDRAGRLVVDAAAGVVDRLRAAGVEPAELQIDFDAASSKLAGYAVWVRAIRSRVAPVPVIVTALPAWLRAGGFAELVDSADGFVLQVHSIERPAGPDAPIVLCDADRAAAWAERAARFGRPFRVALPTYSYLVAFDPSGKFIGLSAEGPIRDWPIGSTLRRVDSDTAALAKLVARWAADRPAAMTGLIWYRLPTATDTMNWRSATLESVMAGRVPLARPLAEPRRVEPALVEIDLTNTGDADAPAAQAVRVAWVGGKLVAGDAANGYALVRESETAARLEPADASLALQRIAPGDRRIIGWLRFDHDLEVNAHVEAPSR